MTIDIDKLTEEELVALNHRIVERLKFLESMHTHNEMMQFNRGEKQSIKTLIDQESGNACLE